MKGWIGPYCSTEMIQGYFLPAKPYRGGTNSTSLHALLPRARNLKPHPHTYRAQEPVKLELLIESGLRANEGLVC